MWRKPELRGSPTITEAVPLPRAVFLCEHAVDTREVTERGRWGMCCVTPWGFLEKKAQGPPSPRSAESSFWQMPGLKSSPYVPKGWINRLLRHNYLPTVPKLVTKMAIVHFHLVQTKGIGFPCRLSLVTHIMHNYHAQLWFTNAQTFDARHFFSQPQSLSIKWFVHNHGI